MTLVGQRGYLPVPNTAALPEDKDIDSQYDLRVPTLKRPWQNREVLIVLILTFANVFLLGTSVTLLRARHCHHHDSRSKFEYHNPDMNAAFKEVSGYCMSCTGDTLPCIFEDLYKLIDVLIAPILDSVPLGPSLRKFEGTFWDNTSIYRQDPSPAVDAAWTFFEHDIITVTSGTLRASHISPSQSVQAPSSWGQGPDAYVAHIDVLHQVHCLNALRKEIHYEHYFGSAKPTQLHVAHRNHCLHILLQTLMCHADTDVIGYRWMHNPDAVGDVKTSPWPDFSLTKRCRNFDAVFQWAKEQKVRDPWKKRSELRVPEGMDVLEWEDI